MLNSEYNPYTAPLAAASAQFKRNAADLGAATRELAWYQASDPAPLHAGVNAQKRKLAAVAAALQLAERQLQQQIASAQAAKKAIPPIWDFLSTTRTVALRAHQQAEVEVEQLRCKLESLASQQRELTADLAGPQEALARYRTFDYMQTQAKLHLIPTEQQRLQALIANLTPRQQAAEAELCPLQAQILALDGERRLLANQISKAGQLVAQLEAASNGFERKQVHQACEAEFGSGNPGQVIIKLKRRLVYVRSSHGKVRKKMDEVTRRHQLDVRTVVIDGSNLLNGCGPGQTRCFLGLAALDVLVPELIAQDKRVIVYFDHGAPRTLHMSGAALRQHFTQWTQEVHIERAGVQADDSILATADLDPHAYIISRDTFVDFAIQYPWLKERLLEPSVNHDRIFVHDMNIRLAFDTAG